MRRPLLAVVGVLAVLVVMTTAAVAVTLDGQRADAPGDRMHGMTWSSPGGQPGWGPGPRGWMHGPGVGTEFAYLTQMVAHHEEAVAAAEELERSVRPQMRAFGESIVETQTAQVSQMNDWLDQWYPGRSTDVDYQPMMRDLSDLAGDRLDRAFLTDMIPHHMMAVMMSHQLLVRGVADHVQVNTLAESIRDEQHAEIFQMQRWLAVWFDAGWGHGTNSAGAWGRSRLPCQR